MKPFVLAIGELLADLISSEYVDRLSEAKQFEMHAGGSPANVCANLHWLGVNTKLVSCVGNDAVGDFLIEGLQRIGLSVEHIHRSRNHPTSIVLVSRSKGTPDFIAYRSADTQIGEIDPHLIGESAVVHTCAFALSRNPAQHHILDALSLARSKQKIISIDWNYAPSLWESDGRLVFQQIMAMQPLLKISMDDMRRFTKSSLALSEAKDFLEKFPCTAVCLTCGKEGIWYRRMTDNGWLHMDALPVDEVKDATGAGDAFWAGFLSTWINGEDIAASVYKGASIAAKKVSKFGPLYL